MPMQIDPKNQPSTAQSDTGQTENSDEKDWMRRARAAYRSSTSYTDSNFRKQWDDSIRAFNNQHPSDSKYSQPAYDKRSKLYRPKIRSVIRKNEAAAAAAFFSNMDVVSIAASDQTDQAQLVSAEVWKQVIQYRLTRTIPWFQTVLGGLQDAQVTGLVCAHIQWLYEADEEEQPAPDEMTEGMEAAQPPPQKPPKVDKPAIDLIPIENIRFDPSASWLDVVNTSPYFIHLLPMYAMDIKSKMESGEWKELAVTSAATGSGMDSTRIARSSNKEDPLSSESRALDDYDIAWVQRHIHRRDGQEWVFYTLGEVGLLTEPVPLKDIVFHGKRPYVIGSCVLETHKALPAGVPMLARGLEDEANEIANQRIDNVKFALNKKWFAKRGVEVDLAGLTRNVPGGVVMMNDPVNDVREITWPDVTQSSYEEQNRINLDMDELLGNFNPAGLMTSGAGHAPARNMAMLNQANGTLVEYLIRTYVETFVQPVLRQLVQLEQAYETDRVILGLAAKNSKMLQSYGIDEVTDELLDQEITLSVNVGMGATDPTQKLQKFMTAIGSYTGMLKSPTPGINMVEVGKEIFGHLGYSDGSRFFTNDNPQIDALQQQVREAGAMIQQLQERLKEKGTTLQVGLQKTRETNQTKIIDRKIREENENKRNLATHFVALTNAPKKAA
jgi:hypothetical protein